MSNNLVSCVKKIGVAACVTFATLSSAFASDLVLSDGVSYKDQIEVGSHVLKLNGAGFAVIRRAKMYALALYLPKNVTTQQAVFASPGPVRFQIIMQKSVSADLMSDRFLSDLRINSNEDERNQLLSQIFSIGQSFAEVRNWNVGDVLDIDWTRDSGVVIHYNGRKIGDTLKGNLIMQVIMRIWVGDNCIDSKLKRQLLGGLE